jgi:hypothetical protein
MKPNKKHHDDIINQYKNGTPMAHIAKTYLTTAPTIRLILKKAGIFLRRNRKYFLDESYFDIIDSEFKAYDFGWIEADGNVIRHELTILVAEKDRNMLEEFLKRIKSDYPIKIKSREFESGIYYYCYIKISSKKLTDTLRNLGCVDNKTNKIRWPAPKIVPKYLLRHFLRGYVDGDGSFFRTPHKNKNLAPGFGFDVVGNETFILSIRKFLKSKLNFKFVKIRKKKGKTHDIFYLRYNGRFKVANLYHLLYDNATMWLNRKKQIAECAALITKQNPYAKLQHLTENEKQVVIKKYLDGVKIIDIVAECKIGKTVIWTLLKQRKIKRNRQNLLPYKKIINDYKHTTMTINKICNKYHVSNSGFWKILKRNKIKNRRFRG